MHFSFPFVITLAAGALAQGHWNGPPPLGHCLNDTSVATLVDGYTYLLEKPLGPDFNSTAEAILSDKFQVFSDSILTLSQRPVSTMCTQPHFKLEIRITDGIFYDIVRPTCLSKQAGLHRQPGPDASTASG